MRRRYQYLWIAVILVASLIALRLALPSIVKGYVNDKLHALQAYDGEVADIDIALWRGAYRIRGIRIAKRDVKQSTPFFSSDRVEFSIEWRSLLRGSLVAEGVFGQPNLNLVQAGNEKQSQLGKEESWGARLEDLFPFRFNTVRVENGTITFRAPGIRTEDALKATQVNGEISNITNVVDSGKEAFAAFRTTATVLDSGSAAINGRVNPLTPSPTFDVNLQLRNVLLPKVNPWLRQYIKADAESGDFELYLELAAADGKFKGYAKPMMRNVQMYSSEEPEKNPLKRLWEGVVDFAAKVLENDETGEIAARIPFTGTIQNPKAGIFETIVSVLHNAFVSAFARSLEGSISLRDVKQNLQDIGDSPANRKAEKNAAGEKGKDKKKPDKPNFGPKR
jgi:hypothetical protein